MRIIVNLALLAFLALLPSCAYLASRKVAAGPEVMGEGVLFRFYAPSAGRVQVAGDWPGNNWARGDGRTGEANIGLMSDENSDGVWEIKVKLPPGRYKYLFLVDENTWHLDPGRPEEVAGGPAKRCSQLVLFLKDSSLEIR